MYDYFRCRSSDTSTVSLNWDIVNVGGVCFIMFVSVKEFVVYDRFAHVP